MIVITVILVCMLVGFYMLIIISVKKRIPTYKKILFVIILFPVTPVIILDYIIDLLENFFNEHSK